MTFIFDLFHFQLMDLTIERWFPIHSDTLYKMKRVVIGPTIVIYFHTTIVNDKKQYFWLILLVICMVI